MKTKINGKIIRIFISENDRRKGKPVYELITQKAKELGLQATVVIRGITGFESGSPIHSMKILQLSEDLPVIVEVIDSAENTEKLLPYLDEVVARGFVTIEDIIIWSYQ